jgi:hypothetical protein
MRIDRRTTEAGFMVSATLRGTPMPSTPALERTMPQGNISVGRLKRTLGTCWVADLRLDFGLRPCSARPVFDSLNIYPARLDVMLSMPVCPGPPNQFDTQSGHAWAGVKYYYLSDNCRSANSDL